MAVDSNAKILLEVRKELFRRQEFDFITVRDGKKHDKQNQALCILTDSKTEELGYGGAAGGAKSWTGCSWLVFMCECFAGTRWFIGREELKRLRESTLITFYKVCKFYGVEGWKYNGQDHFIQFENGSRIDLLDLKYLPSDPFYERYGSTEYTGGWVEEGGEVNFGAYDTLRSRINRHMNDQYGILGKLLVTLNPKKNWCHQVFWKPFKAGLLTGSVKFLQALVTDNPFIDSGYITKLHAIKDKVRKQRLLFGNFDYDDDDNALMDYDSITDVFSNTFVPEGDDYITADVARFGKDKSTVFRWKGFRCVEQHTLEKSKVTETAIFIRTLASKNNIPMSRVIVDEDGVGGGVVDILGCKGFVNGSAALQNYEASPETFTKQHEPPKENYRNLRSQCYYRLADRVNKHEMYVQTEDEELKEKIIEELEQIKKKDPDNDETKLQVISREEIVQLLGRSPDYASALMMREYFELQPSDERVFIGPNGEIIKI
jgi:phage terminase large subunit